MLSRIITVARLTRLSRFTCFARDIVLAAILGAGPLADAFFVALRLPNHFRAIFAEGAFNAAFVPAYARVRGQSNPQSADLFADRVFTLLFVVEVALLALALFFTPAVIGVLAPGLDPGRFALATTLTRITFPYLLLVSLVTLYGGILNTLGRFASPAAAPILLNLTMMVTLALAAFFPTAGHAAAWGVLIAGFLEALLVGGDVYRQGVLPCFAAFRLDDDLRRFFKALGPAILGSAGTQIALLADTIIASLLPAGALSALYYADRLNQLPIGVIGIAVGTVLLPEMASRLARGDEAGARSAQDRAVELTLLLSLPCFVAFLLVPDLIMLALFGHGAFTAADAAAAGATLAAYTVGLVPFVLARTLSATFVARGDTATPVKPLAAGVVVNVALKIVLMKPLAQVGLAFATSIGVWINVALLLWFALRARLIAFDERLKTSTWKLLFAALALAAALWIGEQFLADTIAQLPRFRSETMLLALALVGAIAYVGAIVLLFDRKWFAAFRGAPAGSGGPAPAPPPAAL